MPTGYQAVAPAKLTRGLRITGRRADGFHLIESEMVTVDLADELEINEGDGLEVVDEIGWTGEPAGLLPVISNGPDNLVARALALAGRHASVRLVKRIPSGAGLGGGSSDAAAILRWARCEDMNAIAALGSDIPFCLRGGRALVSGIGEAIEDLPYEELSFLLLTPALFVSTTEVYRAFDEMGPMHASTNDLAPAAIAVEPRLRWWRDLLAEVTGREPVLAGSGSTWFVDGREGDLLTVEELKEAIEKARARACVSLCRAMPSQSSR